MNERDFHCCYSLSSETAVKGYFTATHHLIYYLASHLIVQRSACKLETILVTQLQDLLRSQEYKISVRLHHQVDSRRMFVFLSFFSHWLYNDHTTA